MANSRDEVGCYLSFIRQTSFHSREMESQRASATTNETDLLARKANRRQYLPSLFCLSSLGSARRKEVSFFRETQLANRSSAFYYARKSVQRWFPSSLFQLLCNSTWRIFPRDRRRVGNTYFFFSRRSTSKNIFISANIIVVRFCVPSSNLPRNSIIC